MSFANRTVMITGAAGHLGRAVASTFSAAGARLVLVDRQADALGAAFGLDANHALVAADLLDARQARDVLTAGVSRFGRVDVLCHLAGGFRMGEPVHETSDGTWELLFDVNVRSLLNIANAVVPHMIAGGGGKVVSGRTEGAQHRRELRAADHHRHGPQPRGDGRCRPGPLGVPASVG